LGFLVVLDVFLEIAGTRGTAVVAALLVYLLVRLYRRIPADTSRPTVPAVPEGETPNPNPATPGMDWDSL
jgi:hypothetical protein